MIKIYYAGQELDAPCGRCKGETKHWVLSVTDKVPVKLICIGCKSVHKFHAEKVQKQKPALHPVSTVRDRNMIKPIPPSKFQELIINEQVTDATATCYDISQQWNEGMWIKHPSFGLGRVQKRLGRKMDVLFKDGIKILLSA